MTRKQELKKTRRRLSRILLIGWHGRDLPVSKYDQVLRLRDRILLRLRKGDQHDH